MAPRIKKTIQKKDPNAPKRPQSAYFLWLNESRPRIRAANPDAKITEISKIAGKEWATVPDKTKWEELAAKEKLAYAKAMEEYKEKQ